MSGTESGRDAQRAIGRPFADRDRDQLWKLCPRPICDRGQVFATRNGVRQPPPYRCEVCGGVGFVPIQAPPQEHGDG